MAVRNILLVTASILGEHGQSRALAAHFKAQLGVRDDVRITERDVVALDLPHLDGDEMGSWMTAPAERDAAQHELAARSDTLIEEVLAHDLIVLAVPLYNLGIPSQLKAWFDRILRAGKTFKYTENGPVGLVEGKRALVLAARGGQYAGTAMDTQTGHVSSLLGLIGIRDIDWIYAEGLNMGEGVRDQAMGEARQAVANYTAERL